MRYRVELQGHSKPAFMISCNGVVIHCTYQLAWTLGHDFDDINRVLGTLHARWEAISPRIDKPNHSHWLDYNGDASGQILQE